MDQCSCGGSPIILISVSQGVSPTLHQPSTDRSPQNLTSIFLLLPVELFIRLDSFGVSCLVLKILAVEISAFSLNGALFVEYMYLSRNHDPVTQNIAQSLL